MREEKGEWLDRQDHPLMNNLILNKVFKHLRRRDLKECRLACKTWNVLTILFTRKLFEVTIYGNDDSTKEHKIDNFVKVFGSNKLGIPFARFKLGSFCTTDGIGQEFIQLCGTTIESLVFLEEKFRVEDVSELLKSTRKLETLEIPGRLHSSSGNIVKLFPEDTKPKLTCLKKFSISYEHPKERIEFCPTFLEELITSAENITCISLHDSRETDDDSFHSSFAVLSIIEKLGREPCVQELVLNHSAINRLDYVELLRKMATKRNGLKLKKLEYGTCMYDQDSETILQIISIFKDTLEFLKLDEGKRFTAFEEFPKMTRLTHLEMDVWTKLRFVNLNSIFPVLERINLLHLRNHGYCEFFPDSEPCLTIKTLQPRGFLFNINGFNQMLTVFPNVIHLQVGIKTDCEDILRQIWTQMTQLENLYIYGIAQNKVSMDSVFTGISGHELHEIRHVVNSLEKMKTGVERREMMLKLRNKHSQLPSITNLTKLRTLTLGLFGNGDDSCWDYLTDLTGYFGFYSIQSLRNLTVACELTETCCEILTKDMGLKSWKFTNSSRQDIIVSEEVY